MKINAKKLISQLFVIAVLLLMVTSFAFAEENDNLIDSGKYGDNLTWQLSDDGTLSITGTGAMKNSSGTTPWSGYYEEVKKVTLSKGITTVGNNAFSCLSNVTAVEIPGTVTSIGDAAFTGCTSLKEIIIPNSVKTIGDSAFSACCELKEVKIPDSVTVIGAYAFSGCDKLNIVSIGKNVKTIKMSSFDWCTKLSKITVSASNEYYSAKDNVLFDKNKTKIILYPMNKAATTYTIPGTVKIVKGFTFYGNANLKTIKIGKNVSRLETCALSGCENLECVDFGTSSAKLDEIAFGYSPKLTKYVVSKDNKSYAAVDGVLYDKAKKTIISYPQGKTAASYKIGSKVTTIAYGAFSNCGSLKNVKIPNGVKTIKPQAFLGTSITSFTIPDSTTTIGDYALCSENMTDITIGSGIKRIGEGAITGFTLKKIYFTGDAPASIKQYSLAGDTATVYYPKGNKTWTSSVKKNYGFSNLTWKTWNFAAPAISSVKNTASRKITVKWKKVSEAKGYEIQYSTSKSFSKNVKSVKVKGQSKTSKTISGLKKGKKYYVRMRINKIKNGTTVSSEWSKSKNVTVS